MKKNLLVILIAFFATMPCYAQEILCNTNPASLNKAVFMHSSSSDTLRGFSIQCRSDHDRDVSVRTTRFSIQFDIDKAREASAGSTGFSIAQTIEVNLTVIDQENQPVKGAQILVVGSSATSFTDTLGKTAISCANASQLVVVAPTYKSAMITVDSSEVTITLEKATPPEKSKKQKKPSRKS